MIDSPVLVSQRRVTNKVQSHVTQNLGKIPKFGPHQIEILCSTCSLRISSHFNYKWRRMRILQIEEISNFQRLVTLDLTLDRIMAYRHASLVDLYRHTKFHSNLSEKKTLWGTDVTRAYLRTDGWTDMRPASLRGRVREEPQSTAGDNLLRAPTRYATPTDGPTDQTLPRTHNSLGLGITSTQKSRHRKKSRVELYFYLTFLLS